MKIRPAKSLGFLHVFLLEKDFFNSLLGLISRRATNAAAATGAVLGVLIICWMSVSPKLDGDWAAWRSPFHNFMTIVIGTMTILLAGLAVSRLRRSKARPRAHMPGESRRDGVSSERP